MLPTPVSSHTLWDIYSQTTLIIYNNLIDNVHLNKFI